MTTEIKRGSRYGRFDIVRLSGESSLRVYLRHTKTLIGEIPYTVASTIPQALALVDRVEQPLNLLIYKMAMHRMEPGTFASRPLNQGFGEKGSLAKIRAAFEDAGIVRIKEAA